MIIFQPIFLLLVAFILGVGFTVCSGKFFEFIFYVWDLIKEDREKNKNDKF